MNKEQYENHIDVLAKNAANQNHIDFEDKYWHAMELLLDKKEKRKRAFFWWFFSIVILLICGFTLFFIDRNNLLKSGNTTLFTNKDVIITNSDSTLINHKISDSRKSNNTNQKLLKPTIPEKKIINNHLQDRFNDKLLSDKKIGSKSDYFNGKKSSSLNNDSQEYHSYKNKKIIKRNNEQIISYKIEKQNIDVPTNSIDSNFLNQTSSKSELIKISHSYLKNYNFKNISILTETKSKDESIESKPLIHKKSFLQNLSYDLLLTADLTTDGVNNKQQLSKGIGILFTYSLTKSISITTGFAIAKKLYSADTNTYKNTYSLGNHYLIKDINATCMVYEIPFQFNYLIRSKGKNSFLVSAGLSSYLMNKEDYIYTYDYYGNSIKYPYNFRNENKHFFSVLSISPIFKRELNKKFALQIMPYAKIPLTGIGNGKVKLFSFGLGVLLHYNGFKL